MSKLLFVSIGLSFACSAAIAAEGNSLLFLNRVGETLVKLQLAPAGSTKWGPDQCQFEDDKSVENNEKILSRKSYPDVMMSGSRTSKAAPARSRIST